MNYLLSPLLALATKLGRKFTAPEKVRKGATLLLLLGGLLAGGNFPTFAQTDGATPAATPPDLLSTPTQQQDAPIQLDPTMMRTRLVKVNFPLLGGEGRASDPAPGGSGLQVALNLFDNVQLVAVLQQSQAAYGGGYTWVGEVPGLSFSQVTLVVRDGLLTANIQAFPTGLFQIRPVGNGSVHQVLQINEAAFPEATEDTLLAPGEAAAAAAGEATAGEAAADDGSLLDVMVAYDNSALTAVGSTTAMLNLINLGITESNNALARSGITPRLRLVHVVQLNYTSNGDMGLDLNRLTTGSDGFIDHVHTLRDTYRADLVSLWVNSTASCGIGWLWATAERAFTVAAQGCAVGNFTFLHEIGHNMGARHDWYVDDTNDAPTTYNHGYVNPNLRWRTIMAYKDRCSDQGFNCTRVGYLSNPNVLYNHNNQGNASAGVPVGTSTNCRAGNLNNPPCDADVRRVFNERAATVANFRASGGVVIFADSFETGNLALWSTSSTDSGDLSVSAAARLVGNLGLQALIDSNGQLYVRDSTPTAEPRYWAHFQFDPNSITMANNNAHYIFYGYLDNGTPVLRVEFRRSSNAYQLRTAALTDATTWVNSSWFTISDAPHAVQFDWRAATAAGANNGSYSFWVDGVLRSQLTTLDNDTRRIDHVRLGALAGIDTETRGTYYFDAFQSRRQTFIDPATPADIEVQATVAQSGTDLSAYELEEDVNLDGVTDGQESEEAETAPSLYLPLIQR